ncbi:hypothetical protein FKM82_014947 [Ascaphus truei]
MNTSRIKSSDAPIEELTYRKALRIALDILQQTSTTLSSRHVKSESVSDASAGPKRNRYCTAATTSQDGVSGETEITKENRIGQQKSLGTTEQKITPEKHKTRWDVKTGKKQEDSPAFNASDLPDGSKPGGAELESQAKSSLCENTKPKGQDETRTGRKRTRHSSRDYEEEDEAMASFGQGTLLSALPLSSDIPIDEKRSVKAKISKGKLLDLSGKNSSTKKGCDMTKAGKTNATHVSPVRGTSTDLGKVNPQVERSMVHRYRLVGVSGSRRDRENISGTQTESSETDTERTTIQPVSRYTRHPMPDFEEEIGLISSDLSMEISSPENCSNSKWPEENPEEEEDEELPSILIQHGPVSIEPGMFVWCKFQKYPYWPSVVKAVRKKERKASVLFVEECLSDPSRKIASFTVALRTLKHYDCGEKKQLLEKAREDYGESIDWCEAVISDYRIRMGCGSFSGPFTEYCTADISYPVRKELQCGKSQMSFPSMNTESKESQSEFTPTKSQLNRKVLPDRTRAARDKANERLVEFIVKTNQAKSHLLDILRGKRRSHFLRDFRAHSRHVTCVETYLEDEDQVELVVAYLQSLCEQMGSAAHKLMNGDRVGFILNVLLPEAVIFAISAIDGIGYKKAEEKYLEGPSVSKRERKMFEEQILEKKRLEKLGAKKGSD